MLFHKERAYDSIEHGWYSYLKDHMLNFIPNRTDQDFKTLADDLDLLILTGGDDSLIRRTTEIKIATQMLIQSKPIIGVCHGAFLLTSLLGGSVIQKDGHADSVHSVLYNRQLYNVNSFHNLAIEKVHTTAKILAVDTDGDCESWIDKNIAAIVWHPERMDNPWIPKEILHLIKN